jgi:hypothetical protein
MVAKFVGGGGRHGCLDDDDGRDTLFYLSVPRHFCGVCNFFRPRNLSLLHLAVLEGTKRVFCRISRSASKVLVSDQGEGRKGRTYLRASGSRHFGGGCSTFKLRDTPAWRGTKI